MQLVGNTYIYLIKQPMIDSPFTGWTHPPLFICSSFGLNFRPASHLIVYFFCNYNPLLCISSESVLVTSFGLMSLYPSPLYTFYLFISTLFSIFNLFLLFAAPAPLIATVQVRMLITMNLIFWPSRWNP